MNDLAGLRREYAEGGLDESDAAPDPMTMFRRWLDDVIVTPMHEPNRVLAMVARCGNEFVQDTLFLPFVRRQIAGIRVL